MYRTGRKGLWGKEHNWSRLCRTKAIESLLQNRGYYVSLEGRTSRWRTKRNDLPQGSVRSPMLLNIYTTNSLLTKPNIFSTPMTWLLQPRRGLLQTTKDEIIAICVSHVSIICISIFSLYLCMHSSCQKFVKISSFIWHIIIMLSFWLQRK